MTLLKLRSCCVKNGSLLAYDLEGSYEEAPQGIIENAQRRPTVVPGNLNMARALAKGLRGVSRLHLLLASLATRRAAWLAFLVTFIWIHWFQQHTGLSSITVMHSRGI